MDSAKRHEIMKNPRKTRSRRAFNTGLFVPSCLLVESNDLGIGTGVAQELPWGPPERC